MSEGQETIRTRPKDNAEISLQHTEVREIRERLEGNNSEYAEAVRRRDDAWNKYDGAKFQSATLDQATSRELEIEQVRRRIGEVDVELLRITTEVLPGMMKKQAARRKELERQEALARCSNDPAHRRRTSDS